MNNRLLILDLVLAGTVVWAGVQFHNQWQASKAREAAIASHKVQPKPPLPLQPLANPPAVMATSYKQIALETLFDPSRNPNVPVDPPKPPPPPPPTPALPSYHGYMNLDGPMAIMGLNAGAPHVAVRPGEKIGEFTLVSVNTVEIVLQWQDRVIRKSVDELTSHLPPVGEQAAVQANYQPAPPPPPPVPVAAGPQGEANQFGTKPCAIGDSYPEGAVVDGYRKVLRRSPFGTACLWEPAR